MTGIVPVVAEDLVVVLALQPTSQTVTSSRHFEVTSVLTPAIRPKWNGRPNVIWNPCISKKLLPHICEKKQVNH